MAESGSFRVNSPKVIHESIDGEIIIVNLDNGSYYSLQKVGAEIWSALSEGATATEISAELAARYDAAGADIPALVGQLVAELQGEQLILPAEAGRVPSRIPSRVLSLAKDSANGGAKPAFEPPQLSKYTDMQELLVLDPIHEVDDAGWPVADPKLFPGN